MPKSPLPSPNGARQSLTSSSFVFALALLLLAHGVFLPHVRRHALRFPGCHINSTLLLEALVVVKGVLEAVEPAKCRSCGSRLRQWRSEMVRLSEVSSKKYREPETQSADQPSESILFTSSE